MQNYISLLILNNDCSYFKVCKTAFHLLIWKAVFLCVYIKSLLYHEEIGILLKWLDALLAPFISFILIIGKVPLYVT